MLAPIVLAVVALALIAALVLDRRESRRTMAHILASGDAERWAHARERWDLITRITSPEVTRYAPPPPPPQPVTGAGPAEPLPYRDDEDDDDESHLVGMDLSAFALAEG